jgi:hypothetical protein
VSSTLSHEAYAQTQILNLMSEQPLSVVQTASVLGYSLLPMVALSGISVLLSLMSDT